jgi:hypothetical protein
MTGGDCAPMGWAMGLAHVVPMVGRLYATWTAELAFAVGPANDPTLGGGGCTLDGVLTYCSTIAGLTLGGGVGVAMPFSYTTTSQTVNPTDQPFVWSGITFGDVVSTGSEGETHWSLTADFVSPNGAVPQDAISGSLGFFFGIWGGYLNLDYIPQTNPYCIGLSGGVGTPGVVASVGMLSTGPGTDVRSVITGLSISLSGNLPGGLGGQASVSLPGGGTAVGASFGSPGVNLTLGGSVCF